MQQPPDTPIRFADPTERSYASYFETGQYDRRYPRPNPTTLRRIRRRLEQGAHVLDYGCGSGRYLLPLLKTCGRAAGFDISLSALALLQAQLRGTRHPAVHVLGPELADLEHHLANHGQADIILCVFGVVAHITDSAERAAVLKQLADALKPGSGRLFISVPNASRRFWREQRAAQTSSIRYTRTWKGNEITLPYHLYSVGDLQSELGRAGFKVNTFWAESVFPESMAVKGPVLRWLDMMLTPLCPAKLGYGILAEASV